jgi:diguanylate cyclase (GGDEF)-like protein/PAS domain S-box-containing protein
MGVQIYAQFFSALNHILAVDPASEGLVLELLANARRLHIGDGLAGLYQRTGCQKARKLVAGKENLGQMRFAGHAGIGGVAQDGGLRLLGPAEPGQFADADEGMLVESRVALVVEIMQQCGGGVEGEQFVTLLAGQRQTIGFRLAIRHDARFHAQRMFAQTFALRPFGKQCPRSGPVNRRGHIESFQFQIVAPKNPALPTRKSVMVASNSQCQSAYPAASVRQGTAIKIERMTIISPRGDSFSEEDRLQALRSLELLDTQEEFEYDQLVYLASQICSTPISLISLVDQSRQWFKAAFGLGVRETPRSLSFCAHAIRQEGLFVIEDATHDERFKDNALVIDAPEIRFYAGIPIHAPGGAPVGTLCVIDTQPRRLTSNQCEALAILGHQVEARMDLHQKRTVLESALAENRLLSGRLQSTNAMFQAFMDNGPFMSYVKDPEGRFAFYNKSMALHFKVDRDEWIGKSDHDLFPAELADAYRRHDLDVAASGETPEFSEVTVSPQGDKINWKSYKFPIRDAKGKPMIAGISLDVSQTLAQQEALAKANIELERLATIDPLTGLFNRRVFQSRIDVEFSVVLRRARPLALMILDVDNFKKINDKHGHAAGDKALEFLGGILQTCVRKEDLCVRLGGEEFAVLMPDTGAVTSLILAERIQDALKKTQMPVSLTVSIGIATVDETTTSWEHLFALADEAMYIAKHNGKNRAVIHPAQRPTPSI